MQTFSDVIERVGGYAKVADLLGLPKGTVSAMKTRNSIPAEYWSALSRAAQEQGLADITVEKLASMVAPRRRNAPVAA